MAELPDETGGERTPTPRHILPAVLHEWVHGDPGAHAALRPAAQVAELLDETGEERPPTPRQIPLAVLHEWVHGDLAALTQLDHAHAVDLMAAFHAAAGAEPGVLPLAAAAAAEPFQVGPGGQSGTTGLGFRVWRIRV